MVCAPPLVLVAKKLLQIALCLLNHLSALILLIGTPPFAYVALKLSRLYVFGRCIAIEISLVQFWIWYFFCRRLQKSLVCMYVYMYLSTNVATLYILINVFAEYWDWVDVSLSVNIHNQPWRWFVRRDHSLEWFVRRDHLLRWFVRRDHSLSWFVRRDHS
jgi:hypothetical protein